MRNILFVVLFFVSCTKDISFYVAPDGSDLQAGSRNAPFKTFERARSAVRLALQKQPGHAVTVYFDDGAYALEEPLLLTAEDSGCDGAPVTYKAKDGANPVFTGSKAVARWTLLTSDDEEYGKIQASVRGKVYVADLPEAGITDYGDPTAPGARPELICNDTLQTLARWPDNGFTTSGKAKGRTEMPPTYVKIPGCKEGVFEYTDKKRNRWAAEHDIRLNGYWYWDWAEEFQKVARWDSAAQTVYIQEPYHHYGYRENMRYRGLNLLCEMDRPGEWYLNRKDNKGRLYWIPPDGTDPAQASVRLTCFGAPYMLEIDKAEHVIIDGLTFTESRGSAVRIHEGADNLLTGVRLERFGRDGIHIEGGRNHGVSGCFLSSFGYRGIDVAGGDRKTLSPAGHFVEHSVVERFSLFKRTYEPAVHVEGCGIRIANNLFRQASSSAMRLEGNDIVVEYNKISRVVDESDDQGGIDVYYNPSYRGIVIRYNHWADIAGGTRHGAAGVRLDDMISGVLIYGNLFERCGALDFGAIQINAGQHNVIENNVFYKCHAAVSFNTEWTQERWRSEFDLPVIQKKIYRDVDIRSELYRNKYPELRNDLRKDFFANRIANNLIVSCDTPFRKLRAQHTVDNNTVLNAGNQSIDAYTTVQNLARYGLAPIPTKQIGPREIQ